jgi:hypothetical protein
MSKVGLLSFSRWMAIMLLIASFAIPSAHVAHAAEMEMGYEMISMDCEDGKCDDTSAQQSCLEHCLQTGATQVAVTAVAPHHTETPQGVIVRTVFKKPALKEARTINQKIGPPQNTDHHLTIQKRE